MRPILISLIAVSCAALAPPVWAQKDNGRAGGPKAEGGAATRSSQPANAPVAISDRDRTVTYGYYRAEHAAGNCPPGLAKKSNGCLPPGQAKKVWVVGQPLPPNVVYYPLPPALVLQLTPPPTGYEYVRVANDILLLSVGTRLVASAVADLARLASDR